MKIGELASETGLTVRTIRYYEELGLIKPLERSKGGFRVFSETAISKVELIHYLKSIHLSLNEIKELLLMKKRGNTMGEVVKEILPHLESHAEEARRKIEKYQKIKEDIEKSRSILKKCVDCIRLPTEASCYDCEVIKSQKAFPLVVRLIW
ncbi:MAG: MerR family transcriptional regulator [bacterium]